VFYEFWHHCTAINSPILSEKPELRWIIKPLEVRDSEDMFTDSSTELLSAACTCDAFGVYEDPSWLGWYLCTTVFRLQFTF